MNKGAIQRFAIWARNELIAQVSQRAYQYGITKEGCGEANAVTVGGRALTGDEQKQRKELVDQIRSKGYTQVMEEVAYTWFNRFIALRFMEVNNYLPSHIRVFSDSTGAFKPEILSDVLHLDLPGLNREKVAEYIESNDTEGLYRYLLLTQCNALNDPLPRMFEKMGGYTELLLPNNILKQDSVLGHMVADIPEKDWTDQVQIIGWLYQYYNSELKDDTFALLKKNVKITKERIPSATQLFTPDWIVRYMVENSLGRIYVDKRKNEGIYADGRGLDEMTWHEAESERIATETLIADKMGWKYYLPEAEQTQEVRKQLDEIQNEYATLDVKGIKVIDPCMGSGHILVYAFDVLMQIYEASGYSQRDAAQSILENNLYGLDIDDRAAQLAYFAVMMKARQYDRRVFSRGIQPHVYAIVESNGLDSSSVEYFTNNDPKLKKDFGTLMDELRDAKEYGSILNISQVDFAALYARVEEVRADISMFREIVLNSILPLIQAAEVMAQKYDVVVTNPPYMGISNASEKLNQYAKKAYPISRYDLSTICMEKTLSMCNKTGMMAMINIPVWMSKSSFEDLRYSLLTKHTFVNMLHCGRGIFGSDFGTTAFVIRKSFEKGYAATFHQLFDEMGAVDSVEQKERWFFERKGLYIAEQKKFLNIGSYPIAYSTSKRLLEILDTEKPLSDFAYPRKGLTTGDNDTFIRLWFEVSGQKFSMTGNGRKWFPMTKGGDFRRWYGNNDYVVNWENNGFALRNFKDEDGKLRSVLRNTQFYLRECISWNDTTATGKIAFRYQPEGYISNASGPCVFADHDLFYLFGLLNSIVSQKLLEILAPNMKFEVGQMALVPIIKKQSNYIDDLVRKTVDIVKSDWDSFETSWDFKLHPLVENQQYAATYHFDEQNSPAHHISAAYQMWVATTERRFQQLKTNEEELNRIFIDIYGLQGELTPEVEDKDVTVRKADLGRDIRSLISYAVGCMFGRYSLDKPGLVFAGYSKIEQTTKTLDGEDPELEKFAKQNADGSVSYGSYYHEVNQDNYKSFSIDTDNIIPICDDDYFDDDITGRFVKWVETVYGKETLEENLKFIADALGGKGTPREVIRSYFLNDFYADHCSTYSVTGSGKRPIYWLFDSGKQNGFKALVYLHRYTPDTIGNLRIDYLHKMQRVYESEINRMQDMMDHSENAREVAAASKRKDKLAKQLKECREYDEKISHLALSRIELDLDDGVKVNYRKLQTAQDGKFYEVLADSKNIMVKEKK